MAKTKGKAKVVAANTPSKAEAESVPLESLETEGAATTMTVDKSEEIVMKEETKDGSDSKGVEESEDIENSLDESAKADGTEKNEDGLDESKEVDGTKEIKDSVDASEVVDKVEEKMDAPEKTDDGNKEEKTNEDEKVEAVVTDDPESGKVEERDVTGEIKDNGKGENVPHKKAKRNKRKKKGATAAAAASNDTSKSNEADKQGTPSAAKDLKMADGMGLIFMCNAKTKNDCFNYKVFGLPEGKREMVAKIYKGMRLFLFDTDLKLMHGIYKAASPGGYNLEPEAFKSAFPSQVRYTVLKDCSPLPEEKFKEAIKENYYGRYKFNFQLSSEQVKNLCKLFQNESQQPSKKRAEKVTRPEQELGSSSRGRKRPYHEKQVVREQKERIPSSQQDWKRSRGERARRNDNISRGRDVYPRREAYAPPPPHSLAPPPPLPYAPYAYAPVDDYYYGGAPHQRDPRIRQFVYAEDQRINAIHAEAPPVDDYYYRAALPQLGPRDRQTYAQPGEYQEQYNLVCDPNDRKYLEPAPYAATANPAIPSGAYASPPRIIPITYYGY